MTASPLTIVMYHYVRDLRRSRYPEIKALSLEDFEGQVEYVKKHYNVIGGQDLMNAVDGSAPLPPRPLLLTFDDGYLDHFTGVFPVLEREKLPACFFPPARCILEHNVLDVNKIHFILASTPDKRALADHVMSEIDRHRGACGLAPAASYWEKLGKPGRFDPAEVVFCKRALQRELPPDLRRSITNELFRRLVSTDEAAFSQELYMTPDQIRLLNRHGMSIGSHGHNHLWLGTLTRPQQEEEIDRSLDFLKSVGVDTRRWIMCYPYGSWNDSLLSVLKSRNCVAGLTTEVGLARPGEHNPLVLPRLDTNDLPKNADAPENEWTARAGT